MSEAPRWAGTCRLEPCAQVQGSSDRLGQHEILHECEQRQRAGRALCHHLAWRINGRRKRDFADSERGLLQARCEMASPSHGCGGRTCQ